MANEFVARNGIISLQDSQITGSLKVTLGVTSSLYGTSSWAQYAVTSTNITGSQYYIPVFSGPNNATNSTIFQSGSYTAIRNSTSPEESTSPDILYVNGVGVDTYNILSAHSDRNGYIQLNVRNYNSSTEASSDIVATADNGTETTNYIDMGINSSGFTNTGNVGGANDAYVYSTGNNLYIGNASSGKDVVIFNGGLDAEAEAKVWIYSQGTVGINTPNFNPNSQANPPSLRVDSPNDTTYNIAQFFSNVDNYALVAISNAQNGVSSSSDLALYNNIDPENQLAGYVDLGINSTSYELGGTYPGSAGDAYLFTDSHHLVMGTLSGSGAARVTIFAGGISENDNAKLILYGNNNHVMTGSLKATQGFTGSLHGTSSWATTASYAINGGVTQILAGTNVTISPTNGLGTVTVNATAGAAFPFTGNAVVSGSLLISGSGLTVTGSSIRFESIRAYARLDGDSLLLGNTATGAHISIGAGNTTTFSQVGTFQNGISVTPGGNSPTTALQVTVGAMPAASMAIFSSGSVTVLNISGSGLYGTGSFKYLGGIAASSFTGSLEGTASWANNALTASYAPLYVLTSVTSSMLSGYTLNSATSSGTVLSSSYAQTASYAPNYVLTSVTSSMLSPYTLNSSTSSGAVLSSSYAQTASYAPAYVLTSVTSSMLSLYTLNSATSSGTVLSSSYAQTSSYAPNYVLTSVTGSMLSLYTLNSSTSSGTVLSSSYAQTASYAPLYLPLTGGTINGNVNINGTASIGYLNVVFESSSVIYSTGSNQFGDAANDTQTLYGTVNIPIGNFIVTGSATSTVGFTGSLSGTSSWSTNSLTASYAPSYVLTSVTSSMLSLYALNSSTSSGTVLSSSYAQTASYAPLYVLTSITGSMLSAYTLNSATSSGTVLSASFAQTSSLTYRVSGSMTGSLLGTSSYANYASSSLSSSYAITSSYALNGGVTQIVAGTNVTLSPTNGLGAVTINAGGGGSMTIADEGTAQGTATFLNFIGTGVTATVSSNTGSITISGGGGLSMKSGTASNAAFSGNPKKVTITFATTFGSTNYAVTVTGEDARSWTIESKVAGSFVINSNSNTALAGTTYWHAVAYGES